MTWHRWRKSRVESKHTDTVGGGQAPAVAEEPPIAPAARILKGRKKKVAQAEQPKRPSLRVVSRYEERPDKIPHQLAWYYRKETRPAGPYTLEEMVGLLDEGRIQGHTLVWSESNVEDWTPADEVTLLTSMLGLGEEGN